MKGDITEVEADAIVNAANSGLMGGGGVDGAIHRAGGPAILEECKRIVAERGRLPTGQAVITTAGTMPSRHVIHTVGPVWHGGGHGEPDLLASAYRESLKLAARENLASVAFPAIATGLYGKPIPKQNGAPLRLAVPWKYGFKSIKSIVRFSFTEERPVSFWEEIQASEYGFWANVNPEVSHPRWSQAMETPLGSNQKVPTKLFNGYAEYVGELYANLQDEALFM